MGRGIFFLVQRNMCYVVLHWENFESEPINSHYLGRDSHTQRNRRTQASSPARRTKHQTGRLTHTSPRTQPAVPRTPPGALPRGGPAERRGLPQARVYQASAAVRQSSADGRPNADMERQVVGKAMSPGGPTTQRMEHRSRVRMLAPVTRP